MTRTTPALLAVAALAFTACGGDGDDTSTGSTGSSTAAEVPVSAPSDTDAEQPVESSVPDSAAPADTEPGDSTAPDGTVEQFTGDTDSEFCVVARQIDELQAAPPNPLDGDSYRAAMAGTLDLLPALIDAAPVELADDVERYAAYLEQLEAAFEATDYEVLDVDLGGLPNDAATETARDRLNAYTEQVCGIPDTSDSELPTEGTMRDFLIEEYTSQGNTVEQAECMIGFLQEHGSPGDSEDLGFALIRECGMTAQWVDAGFTQAQAECMVAELRELPEDATDDELEAALVEGCNLE